MGENTGRGPIAGSRQAPVTGTPPMTGTSCHTSVQILTHKQSFVSSQHAGTWLSATIHIVCAVIGAGVLALPQARAHARTSSPGRGSSARLLSRLQQSTTRLQNQCPTLTRLAVQAVGNLGWIAGPLLLCTFFVISLWGEFFPITSSVVRLLALARLDHHACPQLSPTPCTLPAACHMLAGLYGTNGEIQGRYSGALTRRQHRPSDLREPAAAAEPAPGRQLASLTPTQPCNILQTLSHRSSVGAGR